MNKPTALVVDDDAENCQTFENALQMVGFEVTTAKDGVLGLHLYRQADRADKPFDFVLSDFQMPRMNGVEMVCSILALNEDQKIAMMTADSGIVSRQLKAEKQDVRVFQKPFSLKELFAYLKEVGFEV